MKKSAMLGRATTGGVVTTPIAQPPEPPTPHVGSNIRIEHDGCQHGRHSDAGSDQKTCEGHAHGLEAYPLEEHGLEEHGLHCRRPYHISSRAHSLLWALGFVM
jgi:hypothetical protein